MLKIHICSITSLWMLLRATKEQVCGQDQLLLMIKTFQSVLNQTLVCLIQKDCKDFMGLIKKMNRETFFINPHKKTKSNSTLETCLNLLKLLLVLQSDTLILFLVKVKLNISIGIILQSRFNLVVLLIHVGVKLSLRTLTIQALQFQKFNQLIHIITL